LELVYFVLAAFGLTNIIAYGKIFDPVRPSKSFMKGFFYCPMCLGFWAGAFLFGINDYTELFTFDYNMVNFFILSCLSSGTTYLLTMFLSDFGFRLEVKNNVKS
jgi:hypothetical protein